MQAIKHYAIVEVLKQENTTDSGLIISGNQQQDPVAQVVSVGPDCDAAIVVGKRVVVDWTRARSLNYNNRTYYVVDHNNVLAVYQD